MLDICDKAAVSEFVAEHAIDLIVNCAGASINAANSAHITILNVLLFVLLVSILFLLLIFIFNPARESQNYPMLTSPEAR